MILKNLAVRNFRNVMDENINFSEGVNVLYGENAHGKTNIIEALWMLTGARSFRGAKDKELISFGERNAEIFGKIDLDDRDCQIKISIKDGKRLAEINGISRGAAPNIIGNFKCVIFSPEHLSLVKGGPENRRKFLDAAICQLKPTYTAVLLRYNRTLRQRNALLKNIACHPELKDTLDVWDKKLSDYAYGLLYERVKYIKSLCGKAQNLYCQISGNEPLSIKYTCEEELLSGEKKETAGNIFKRLWSARKNDIQRGFTSVGPHRDDLYIDIDGRPAKLFGSQGQQRSAVIALKIAEAEIIREITGESPVILMDDILSELDENRQRFIMKSSEGLQTVITGCMKPRAKENIKMFQVRNGTAREE